MYKCIFILLWTCVFYSRAAKKFCDFKFEVGNQATVKCKDSPTGDVIFNTMRQLEYKNVFGITSLVMASCNITKFNVGTFHIPGFGKIISLRLEKNRLTSLPEDLFNYLTELGELYLQHNELSYLKPEHFANLLNLHALFLSYNKFTTFEAGLFIPNPIKYLYLDGNYIEILPDDFLAGNISITLKRLVINSNKLKGIPGCISKKSAFQAFFPELEWLSLGKNNIRELPTDWFNSTNWSFLKYLDLSFNHLETLPRHMFYSSSLSKLELLQFSHNKISLLSEKLFNHSYLQNLQEINFSHNNITNLAENLFNSQTLQNLEKINFSHNHISDLPEKLFHSQYLQNLNIIDLSYNQINSLPSTFLKNQALENVKSISLNNNNIKYVTVDMLPIKVPNLCHLNLANNKISSIGELLPKVLQNKKQRGFVFSQQCKLDLSKNSLTVQRTKFIQSNAMESHFLINTALDLSYNNIGRFEVISLFLKSRGSLTAPFITVPLQTKWLSISGNQPFSVKNLVQAALNIDLYQAIPGFGISPNHFVKELLRLHVLIQEFPYDYVCNCDMIKYLKLLDMPFFKKAMDSYKYHLFHDSTWSRYSNLTSDNFTTRLKCGSPSHLYGKYLYQLKKILLQCEYSSCTNNAKCRCIETPYNNTIRIDCTEIGVNPIQAIHEQNFSQIELYMGFNGIQEFPEVNTTISLHVILLDLSYNYITNIPSTFFSHYGNIKYVNLAGNHLLTIPSDREWRKLHSLNFLQLTDNIFSCGCPGLQTKKTLEYLNCRMLVNIKDIKDIKCSTPQELKDRLIYKLEDTSFVCPVVNLVLIFTLTLSFLSLTFVVLFCGYIFRYYIRLFLFINFGWRFWYSYTKDKTLYDAFISYSSKDSDWVIDHLMNPLENLNPPYNLCLHERDFLIGVPICDNIGKVLKAVNVQFVLYLKTG